MNTFRNFGYALLITSNFLFTSLHAEIQKVIIKWNPYLCQSSCIKGLEARFKKIPAVLAVEMNEANGMATLHWKPTEMFSFVPINYALRYIGIREKDVRIQLVGRVAVYKDTYSITANHTNFILFNRVSSTYNQYATLFSPYNRELSPELKLQLAQAQKNNLMVNIEGPLFMPERSPPDPLRLVIDQIHIEKPKAESSATPKR